jgi:zearalenone synthase (highly reducing iterative type I polyketide synthase)
VTEVIAAAGDRAESTLSKLPSGIIVTSRAYYAIPNSLELLPFDENAKPVAADQAPADVLIVSGEIAGDLEAIALMSQQLAKPEAIVIINANNALTASLTGRGYRPVSTVDNDTAIVQYSPKDGQTEAYTNGKLAYEAVLVEPSATSATIKGFSSAVQDLLKQEGHNVIVKSWDETIKAEDVKGKVFISLLELEQPLLDNMSERDFENVRTVVLNCERLLWITRGDNPALGMVDGFARCMMSENAGMKFQVLHLSQATGLQHGPALAAQILDSESSDNEYREVDGLLQVARIVKSHEQNQSIRHHLEDSTRFETLGDEALRLSIGKPGLLDTLRFVSDERMGPPLGDDEVEVEVKATGLK